MKLLNLGCGFTRPGSPWINVDSLRAIHAEGTPERFQIDATHNYIEADLRQSLPFEDMSIDGCLLCHVLEHFDAQEGLRLLIECYRVLKPGGVVLVSVPDASYFRKVYPEDRNENWPRLFEQTDPNNPIPTFMEAALFFNEHKAILTEDTVWCYIIRAGFARCISLSDDAQPSSPSHDDKMSIIGSDSPQVRIAMYEQLNRRIFSVEMIGVK